MAAADTAIAFTGAGASTESGIPDFRGPGGLWERYDPDAFHIERFRADPADFWETWLDVRGELLDADIEPNPAHEALAEMEATGCLDAVITQNVDGLHRAAGSEEVLSLHGRADRVVCSACDRRSDARPTVDRARNGATPPRCLDCDGLLKPDTVFFGEALPRRPLLRAQRFAESCGCVLVVGSSVTVEPAATIPRTAVDRGATLVEINAEPTPLADRAEHVFREPAGDVLPQLAAAVPSRS